MTTPRNYYIYDLECYPNTFLFAGKWRGDSQWQQFEISDRMNDRDALVSFLGYLRNTEAEMVGFNSLHYDYAFIHELVTNPYTFSFEKAFELSQRIITSSTRGFTVNHVKWTDRVIPQIDIVKYQHFDNENKRTSLKALQFAMRSTSLEDLPFKIRPLNNQEKDRLREYNVHDITETEKFFNLTEHAVDMRREYLEDGVLQGDVLNYSDVKIGTEYLITRLGRNKCYAGSKPRQTIRTEIPFAAIILPKIQYRTEIFHDVLEWFRKQTYYVGGKNSINHEAKLGGLDFHFGVGGVHASAENKVFQSDDEYQIIDIDVAGMYPSVAIVNQFAPAHLGQSFVAMYSQIKSDRARYAKGTAKNAALKLASNGAYGNSNNPYSPLYDPQFTFSVTVNGQLQLLQLVELLSLLPGCELIQANTDGITVRMVRRNLEFFDMWCKDWEATTGLELERVEYDTMWIRDVNNYIAKYKGKDKFKLKGAYWYPETVKDMDGWWNKDFSNLASIKAAVVSMTRGLPVEVALRLVTDPFDYMLRYKATGDSVLFIGQEEQLKTVRYYVSASGQKMKKVSPPKGPLGDFKRANSIPDATFDKVMAEIGPKVWDARVHTKNRSTYQIVETSIQSGKLVRECNRAEKFDFRDVDWTYYIEEAKKLIVGNK